MNIARIIQTFVDYKKYLLIVILLSMPNTFVHAKECYPKAREALVDIGQKIQQSIKKNAVDEVKKHFDSLLQHSDIAGCPAIRDEVIALTQQEKQITISMQKKASSSDTAPNDSFKRYYVKAHVVHNNIQQILQNTSAEKIDTDLEEFNLHEPSSNCSLEAEKRIRQGKKGQEIAFSINGSGITFDKVLFECDALLKAKADLIVSIYQHNEGIRKGARKQELANWKESHIYGNAQQEVFDKEKRYIPKVKALDLQIIWQYKSSTTARSRNKNYIADTEISVMTEIETRTTQCTDYRFSSDGEQVLNKKVYDCDW